MGNLGSAYYSLGQVENAIDHYQQALNIHREIGDRRGEGANFGQPGERLQRPGPGGKSHRPLPAGVDHLQGNRGSKGRGQLSWATWGSPTKTWARWKTAIDHYQQALTISREIGDRRGEGNSLGQPGARLQRPGSGGKSHRPLPAGVGHLSGKSGIEGARATNWATWGAPTGIWVRWKKPSSLMEESLSIFEEIKSPNAELAESSFRSAIKKRIAARHWQPDELLHGFDWAAIMGKVGVAPTIGATRRGRPPCLPCPYNRRPSVLSRPQVSKFFGNLGGLYPSCTIGATRRGRPRACPVPTTGTPQP